MRKILRNRPYVYGALAGISMFVVVEVVDRMMVAMQLRREVTFFDNLLLGGLTAILVVVLELQHRSELRRQQERIALIIEMNHHIRNALQSIVYVNSKMPEQDAVVVREATRRIEWALREILPGQGDSKVAPAMASKSSSSR